MGERVGLHQKMNFPIIKIACVCVLLLHHIEPPGNSHSHCTDFYVQKIPLKSARSPWPFISWSSGPAPVHSGRRSSVCFMLELSSQKTHSLSENPGVTGRAKRLNLVLTITHPFCPTPLHAPQPTTRIPCNRTFWAFL